MREVERIQTQMGQAFSGDSWVNVSLMSILENVDTPMAAARPFPNLHTIWEIALHLHSAQLLILHRLQEERSEADALEAWPSPPEPTEIAWKSTIAQLRQAENELQRLLRSFHDERLDESFVEGGTSAYNNLHGYIQHAYYHMGQIQLLKTLSSALK